MWEEKDEPTALANQRRGCQLKREGRQAAAGKARLTLNRTTAATSERGAIVE
jgi:hypothetical protein